MSELLLITGVAAAFAVCALVADNWDRLQHTVTRAKRRVLLAVYRSDCRDRHVADFLHRLNRDAHLWAGHRFHGGNLRDPRGRFANPDKEAA